MRVTVLAGGVGGAKLVTGLAGLLDPEDLTVIGNVGDDVELHGLWISPDMDILTYSLAGVVDRKKGWGFADETFNTLDAMQLLGEETWFLLGDKDLATHIFRTRLRREGIRPTEIALRISERLGVTVRVIPPTDDSVRTIILTASGWLNFQEYFVREQCVPEIESVAYEGAEEARPTSETLAAIENGELIIIAPSNPVASIGPILAIPGVKKAIRQSPARKVSVSPIVGGRSLKGPADRMLQYSGLDVSPLGIARYYDGLIDTIVIDCVDTGMEEALKANGLRVLTTSTIVNTESEKLRLAESLLNFCGES